MNKLLIVLLAVCLVSVHAFVKRDAPESKDALSDVGNKIKDLADNFKDAVSKAFDPEKVKKDFNEFVDQVNKAFDNSKQKPAA